MKKTRTRKEVFKILEKSHSGLSAQEIFNLVEKENVNLSTIYRTLALFEKEGLVRKEVSPFTNEAKFQLVHEHHDEHGHILECIKCHKQIDLDYCPFEDVNEEIKNKTGFELVDENHVLYGVCKDCKSSK